jgi:hypothetical protein
MKLILVELAKRELHEAMIYYDEQESGLGNEFIDEVNLGFSQILKHPEAWPYIYNSIRALRVARFDFRIVYSIAENEIIVVAICHCTRRPFYWVDRLSQ